MDEQQAQPSGMPPEEEGGPLTDMIVQTDQALTAIAQVLAKASPEAAQAMAAINEQYRQIIQSVMSGGGPEQGAAGPSQMVDPNSQGRPGAAPAY